MFQTDVVYLLTATKSVDEYGDPVVTEAARGVFCTVRSIGQSEFYQADAVGLKPEIKFILNDYLDYQGELFILWNGQRYHVLRTYRNGQKLEMTCYAEVNPSVAPTPNPDEGDGN